MDWTTFANLFDKYGYPTILLALLGLFFYRKIWPLFERFILGILDQLKSITTAIQNVSDTLQSIDQRTQDNLEAIRKIAEKERKE